MSDANPQSPEFGGTGPAAPGVPPAQPMGQPGNFPPAWQGRYARRGRSPLHGVITGFLIVIVGVLFLLQNLGLFRTIEFWQFWPVLLIGFGLSRLLTNHHPAGRIGGLVATVLGVLFLLSNLHILPHHAWNYIWPLALIFWGLTMAFFPKHRFKSWDHRRWDKRGPWGPNAPSNAGPMGPNTPGGANFADDPNARAGGFKTTTSNAANRLNEYAILGGIKRRVDSQEFEGGEATAVLGGIELDLSRAGTKLDELTIEANAFMGGVEIRVPQNWDVTVQGMGILGGYDDSTRPFASAPETTSDARKRPHLIITGQAMCGGVQVKN